MTIQVNTSGAQSTTIGSVEDALATITAARVLTPVFDINTLTSAEFLELILYGKARASDTERQIWRHTASGNDSHKLITGPSLLSPHHCRLAILQRAGTSRSIPWAVYESGNAALNASGSQSTTIGATPDVLATVTAAKILQPALDISALATTEFMTVILYGKARSGDAEREIWRDVVSGNDSDKLVLPPALVSPHHYKLAILQEAGTSRAIPWGLYEAT